MKRIEVTSCGGCPFADASSDMAYQCTQAGGRVAVRFDAEPADPNRPDWCPLEAGPVAVALESPLCTLQPGPSTTGVVTVAGPTMTITWTADGVE